MDSLQLQTILRILPTALENANYETLKQIQDEIDKAKLRIFDPPYLEYFHDDFDIEKYKNSYPVVYNKFKKLNLNEEKRIKDPRLLEMGDNVTIIIYNYIKKKLKITTNYKYHYYNTIRDNNKFRLNFDDKNHDFINFSYIIDCKNLKQFVKFEPYEPDITCNGKLYIYK